MSGDSFFTPPSSNSIVERFLPNTSATAARSVFVWRKPRGTNFLFITMVGAGGNGGDGAVGANSAAAGGGGGGAGGRTNLVVPLALLPDVLYIQLATGGSGLSSFIGFAPGTVSANPPVQHMLMLSAAGGVGGNAAGATAGTAGTAASNTSFANSNAAGLGIPLFLPGQAGAAGGTTGAGVAIALPLTGVNVTGGGGGGGLPAAGAASSAGGNVAGTTAAGTVYDIKTITGGASNATATNPGNPGSPGQVIGQFFNTGGGGGASSHGTATGAGLFGGNGGNGAPGCGGGGGGGCLTGGVAGVGGRGGPAFADFVCW